jgi:hypothetical protein
MNWLLRLLGYRDREYSGNDFSVRIELVGREGVSVIHRRQGTSLNLSGDRIGRKREAIELHIPQDVEATQIPQIVRDIETAFVAMRYGYVIARKAGIDIVPGSEQQSAIAELHEMGYEIERLADGRIRQTRRAAAPRPDIETLRKDNPSHDVTNTVCPRNTSAFRDPCEIQRVLARYYPGEPCLLAAAPAVTSCAISRRRSGPLRFSSTRTRRAGTFVGFRRTMRPSSTSI